VIVKCSICLAAAWLTVAASAAPAQEARTLKERLSDKASDAQRVNNCRVPVERRGPVPRPGCAAKPPASSAERAIASPAAQR
jgi:hypothetical protein